MSVKGMKKLRQMSPSNDLIQLGESDSHLYSDLVENLLDGNMDEPTFLATYQHESGSQELTKDDERFLEI